LTFVAGRIEELIQNIESLNDSQARENAIALVQALMELHGSALERLMDLIAEKGEPGFSIFDSFARDEAVAGLLLLYGLHPLPLETRVANALEKVKPYLDSHGGSVKLLEIVDGHVFLQLEGNCKSCPSSSQTLKLAIEEAIYAAAPDIASIQAEGVDELVPQIGFVQIGRRNGSSGGPICQ